MRVGKITENALKRSVLKPLRTEYKSGVSAAVGTDCAFFEDKKTITSICPFAENISDIGYYAVMKAAGALYSQGVKPNQVNLSILLPEETEESVLKTIVKDALEAARLCDVPYTGGHTEVTGAVNRPVVTASCAAVPCGDELFLSKPKAGDVLVISKWIALEGTAMLAKEKFRELTTRYPVPFVEEGMKFKNLMDIRKEMEIAIRTGITSAHDLSNGGVYAGLWDMAARAGCGLKADLKSIPVRQETVEICEFFEVNPYQLLSGGAVLFATEKAEELVAELQNNDIPASIVGILTEGNDKIVNNSDETRFLEMPQTDEIHKILG